MTRSAPHETGKSDSGSASPSGERPRTRAPRRCALLLLSGLAACSRPAVTEQDLPSEPAWLSVDARLFNDPDEPGPAVWLVDVGLDPGLERGLRRHPGDTLLVDGQPVLPEPSYGSSTISYRASVEIARNEVHRRPVAVVPPEIDGLPRLVIRLIGIGRAGPDTLRWTPGSDLRLRVNLPAAPPEPAPSRWGWSASVVAERSFLFGLGAHGLPPAEIVVPAAYLAGAAPPVEARLDFHAFYHEPSYADAAYEVRISARGVLAWAIEVAP